MATVWPLLMAIASASTSLLSDSSLRLLGSFGWPFSLYRALKIGFPLFVVCQIGIKTLPNLTGRISSFLILEFLVFLEAGVLGCTEGSPDCLSTGVLRFPDASAAWLDF